MRHTSILLAVALVASVLSTSVFAQAGKTTLKLDLPKGKTFSVTTTMVQDIAQSVMGMNQKLDQTMGFENTYEVVDKTPAGAMTIAAKYTAVLYKQSGPQGTIDYDSKKPGTGKVAPAAQGFKGLVGQGFKVTAGPDGIVTKVEGAKEMIEHMLQNMDIPAGPAKDQVVRSLSNQFGEEALKEMFEQSFNIYPDKPVAPGDKWQKKITLTKGFPMIMDSTYELVEVKDGKATVKLVTKVTPNKSAGEIDMGGLKMAYSLSGTQTGTLTLDVATGWVMKSIMDQDFAGDITMSGVPGLPGGSQKMPMTVKSKVTVESK